MDETCQFGSVTRTSSVRSFFSCQLLICTACLTCSNLLFQDTRRRSADDALWNGKREIHFKGSRFRYLATRGGMALAVRRCVTGISSSRLGVAFLVDIHRMSVNRGELRFAAACMASRKAWYRDAKEKHYRPKESNHIDRVLRFALHLHSGDSTNTVVSRRTKLHNCERESARRRTFFSCAPHSARLMQQCIFPMWAHRIGSR